MKILLDLSAIEDINWGVSVYALRILKGFEELGVTNVTLLVNRHIFSAVQASTSFDCILLPELNCALFRLLKISSIVNGYLWKQTINKSACDVFFSPSSSIYHFWKLKKIRVQTIHDLQGLRVYRGKALFLYKICTPLLLKHSNALISISDYVRNDILNTYKNISNLKITTIYNSVIIDTPKSRVALDYKYILYVNALKEYKNVMTLIQSFSLMKDMDEYKLLIIAKTTDYWLDVVLPFIILKGLLNRIVHISDVSNEELIGYYKNASLFVTTSLFEGFGFTPIEAAICCTPVISTKETALYETTMGLLNYYEPPTDCNSLCSVINEVLRNPPSCIELKRISNILSEKYNYISQAKKIYDFLNFVYCDNK